MEDRSSEAEHSEYGLDGKLKPGAKARFQRIIERFGKHIPAEHDFKGPIYISDVLSALAYACDAVDRYDEVSIGPFKSQVKPDLDWAEDVPGSWRGYWKRGGKTRREDAQPVELQEIIPTSLPYDVPESVKGYWSVRADTNQPKFWISTMTGAYLAWFDHKAVAQHVCDTHNATVKPPV